jgi:hypothetical protein
VFYDVYQLCGLGTRMPNNWVVRRGKVRGKLVFEQSCEQRYFAQLVSPDNRDLLPPLDHAWRYQNQDGRVKVVGLQHYGSQSPKSLSYWNVRQIWLCSPVNPTDSPESIEGTI